MLEEFPLTTYFFSHGLSNGSYVYLFYLAEGTQGSGKKGANRHSSEDAASAESIAHRVFSNQVQWI